MARGFEIETALGAPFSLARRRPVTVFAWGVLTLLPILPMLGVLIPVWAAAAQSGHVPDDAMVGQMVTANVFAQLGQVLQWVVSVVVMTAVVRAATAGPKTTSGRPFFLGFGMAELMVGVSFLAILILIYGAMILLAIIGVGLGFAVWGIGAPWNVLLIVLYGVIALGAVFWLALRLSLLCVVAADRRTLDLPVAWRATKGQVGRLLLLCILLWLASVAIGLIVIAVMGVLGLGAFFASGLRFEMFAEGAPPPDLSSASVAILASAGVVLGAIFCWVTGVSQALTIAPFASVWKQLEARAAAKPADAPAPDAIGSPEL